MKKCRSVNKSVLFYVVSIILVICLLACNAAAGLLGGSTETGSGGGNTTDDANPIEAGSGGIEEFSDRNEQTHGVTVPTSTVPTSTMPTNGETRYMRFVKEGAVDGAARFGVSLLTGAIVNDLYQYVVKPIVQNSYRFIKNAMSRKMQKNEYRVFEDWYSRLLSEVMRPTRLNGGDAAEYRGLDAHAEKFIQICAEKSKYDVSENVAGDVLEQSLIAYKDYFVNVFEVFDEEIEKRYDDLLEQRKYEAWLPENGDADNSSLRHNNNNKNEEQI